VSTASVYTDADIELTVEADRAVVYDRLGGSYFMCGVEALPARVRRGLTPYPRRQVSLSAAVLLVLAAVSLALVNGFLATSTPWEGVGPTAWLIVLGYAGLSVGLHEYTHIVLLRMFGRAHDAVGFRMHYVVFPAVYVRMGQSALLPRAERAVVHVGGVTVNLAVNLIGFVLVLHDLLTREARLALHLVAISLIFNVIPIMSSDGYRTLMALSGTSELKRMAANPPWLLALKVLGVVVACFVGLRLVQTAVSWL
jgi:hypothetical protein